jgi:hypothetical protein
LRQGAQVEGSAGLAGLAEAEDAEIKNADPLANLATAAASTECNVPPTTAPAAQLSSVNKPEKKASAVTGDSPNRIASGPDGKHTPSVQAPDFGKRTKQPQEPQIASMPANGTLANKSFSDRSQKTGFNGSIKHVSTQPSNIGTSSFSDTPVAESSGQQPRPAADSAPPAAPSSISEASAKKTIDVAMTAPAVPQSASVTSGLADFEKSLLGSETATSPKVPATSSKIAASSKIKDTRVKDPSIKDPSIKGKAIKDPPVAASRSERSVRAQASTLAEGLTKFINANGREASGFALPNRSDALAKSAPLKQSAATQFPAAAQAEADAPDEALPTSAPSPVTTAKLVQGISQSEFHVGMQSQEFGNIAIRTSVARHMFSAQISVEHGEVAKSMTAELPVLYHRLADQQVPVANIVIQGQSLATSSGLAQDAQPQNWGPQNHGVTRSNADPGLPVITETLDPAGRLDIRV